MGILTTIKQPAKRLLPTALQDLARYTLNPARRARSRLGKRLATASPLVMLAGPFAGMRYADLGRHCAYLPKLLGTYERELAPVFAAMPDRFDGLIDVGAAEGYYAVGLLRAHPAMRCSAFEADAALQQHLRRTADLNGVSDRLDIAGLCTPPSLASALAAFDRPFLLSDCEGGEYDLLDPDRVAGLQKATILAEIHGHPAVPPGTFPDHPTAMAHLIADRLRSTHRAVTLPIVGRTLADWPSTVPPLGTPADRLAAMDETRLPGPGWLLLEPLVTAKLIAD